MSRKSEHLPEPQPQPCEHVSSKTEESIVDQLLNYHRSLSEPVLKTLHQRVLVFHFKCTIVTTSIHVHISLLLSLCPTCTLQFLSVPLNGKFGPYM
jgi:hypothetical protein